MRWCIKVLFINSRSADYVQDLSYSGLVKVLGKTSVTDFYWSRKLHLPLKKYPKNLGYTPGTVLSSVLARWTSNYDLVVVAAAKADCFEAWIRVMDSVSDNIPVIFLDGGDRAEIAGDLARSNSYHLYEQVVKKRPFDLVFKREYLVDVDYDENVFPFQIAFNYDRLPTIAEGKKYDVSFWAVETGTIRTRALELLENAFDCRQNGTVRNQTFKKYKRKGDFYLQELAACKIVLNFRGDGWDTLRYWEVPAVGAFMLSQKPGIVIPHDFVEGEHVVYCRDDLSDLIDLCQYYLEHNDEREKIVGSAHSHAMKYHSDIARAEYILSVLSKHVLK